MTTLGRRQKCLTIWSEKRQFRASYVNAGPNRSVAARWKGLRAQTGLDLCVCKPNSLGASLSQDVKRKFRFTLAEALADRIRSFRADRVIAIKAGDTPLEIEPGPKIVVHLVPLSAFSGASKRDLGDALGPFVQQHLISYKPMGNPLGWDHRVNIDGRLIYIVTGSGAPARRSYKQIFRSGIVETVRHLRP
jgi:hypothetical protein